MATRAIAAGLTGVVLMAGAAQAAQPARPDLTGVWNNTTITPLARPSNTPSLVVDEAQAKTIAQSNGNVRRAEQDARPSNVNAGAPTDGNTGIGYNAGWMDPGSSLAKVKGQYRTSWIVEPADGQLPLTEAARALGQQAAARARVPAAGPEYLAPNDRCLIGSRGSGGPGMLNNLYNNNYQIVQTRDALVIVVEMVHDARIIPIFASKAAAQAGHGPAVLQPWLGDGVAWWEGDALVVETMNVNPEQGRYGPIYLSPKGKVTERFSRIGPREIFYAFEVDDPANYTQVWRAEMSLKVTDGEAYEYACHEGNYAMEGILAGARADEKAGATRTSARE